MENRIVLPSDINNNRGRLRRVVFYGRVSTEHEAQLSALENQMQWYDDVAGRNTNWKIINKYIDEGITGTQAKKRPAFLRMINDARNKKFDLIVTREVCRFARNTVDTLVVTRELKGIGIEVYFVEDNIWTMDGDGELRLTIMATLAQEESRKTSERVRAGQKISRDKGVLYGNGNILGYDRDKNLGTYVINKEQAETVHMIFDLYESGMGMSRIRDELIRRKRKASSGLVKWDVANISRVLRNATYKGYQGYMKSYRNNFLDQKLIRNNDERDHLYIKGNYEPIISEEQWDHCHEIRTKCRRNFTFFTPEGEKQRLIGMRMSDDIWVKKLRCRCGYHFRRDKWRRNKFGELVYGYKCYNQLNYGRKTLFNEAEISGEKACDLKEFCDWKLELMALHIFSNLWGDKKDILNKVSSIYKFDVAERSSETDERKFLLVKEIEKLKEKIANLTRMRIENEIEKDEFIEYKETLEKQKADLIQKMLALDGEKNKQMDDNNPSKRIEDFLFQKMDFSGPAIDRDIAMQFVDMVKPVTEVDFDWYLDFDMEKKPIEEKEVYWEFTIGFDEAKAFKKLRRGILRNGQWTDLHVKVYI